MSVAVVQPSGSDVTVTDLFCGAGGSSQGARKGGATVRMSVLKRCITCGQEKSIEAFYARPNSPDGHRNDCKDCTKARAKKSADAHVEERREYLREYARRNPDRVREHSRRSNKRWTQRGGDRRYRAQHRDQRLANERRYRQRHRDREIARRHERRALGMTVEAKEYIAVLLGDPCAYCGSPAATIDHIIPVAQGGTNDLGNLTAACTSCNSQKNDKSLIHYLAWKIRTL